VNKPSVTEGIGFINYAYPELGLRIVAERYTDEGYAELRFFSVNGSGESLLLHTTRVNLLATPSMNSLSKRLKENSVDAPWTDILTFVTGKTLEIARRGEPIEEIWPAEGDSLQVEYLLEPTLYHNHPTVLFGDYGSLKSLVALAIAYIVQLPYHDNDLGLITADEPTLCLFLDYEDDPSSFRKRWTALESGFGKGTMPILYRRMTSTLADSVESLQRIIHDRNVGLIIVDSLGPAARGNLNDPEPAIKYHATLRQLGITSLTLAHTSKDQLTKRRTIFGSVFFTNLARSVWECKAEQETAEDEAVISLKHTKANLSRLHPPLGYRFTFTDDTIKIQKADLRDTGLSGELPLSWQIKSLLRKGRFTVKEIASQLESGPDTIGRTLRRMRTKNQVTKLEDDTWGLYSK
jgi:hypothetical protein